MKIQHWFAAILALILAGLALAFGLTVIACLLALVPVAIAAAALTGRLKVSIRHDP